MAEQLAERRARHAATLERELDRLVEQFRGMPDVHTVIVFGSFAAGRRDLGTDLDVIVVVDSERDFVARNVEVAGRIRCGVALDLLVYTPDEVERMRDRPFIRGALATGKVLYEIDSP